jgi:hypothetical protein
LVKLKLADAEWGAVFSDRETIQRSISLEYPSEWHRWILSIDRGDTLSIRADGDGPFYAKVYRPGEFDGRKVDSQGLAKLSFGSARLSHRIDLDPVDVAGDYVLLLTPRWPTFNLEADVEIWIERYRGKVINLGDGGSPVEEFKLLPDSNRLWSFLSGLALGILALLLIVVANLYVLTSNPSNLPLAVSGLVAGDGTLALATVTYFSLTRQQEEKHLAAVRAQRTSRALEQVLPQSSRSSATGGGTPAESSAERPNQGGEDSSGATK